MKALPSPTLALLVVLVGGLVACEDPHPTFLFDVITTDVGRDLTGSEVTEKTALHAGDAAAADLEKDSINVAIPADFAGVAVVDAGSGNDAQTADAGEATKDAGDTALAAGDSSMAGGGA